MKVSSRSGCIEPAHRENFVKPLGWFRRGWIELGQHTVHGGEFRGVEVKEGTQSAYLRFSCRIAVHADGPKAGEFSHRLPKLLRNPGEAAAGKRHAGKAVGEQLDSLAG